MPEMVAGVLRVAVRLHLRAGSAARWTAIPLDGAKVDDDELDPAPARCA